MNFDFLALIGFIFWIVSRVAKANRASQAKQQREDAKQADNRFGQPTQRQISVFDQAAESTNQVPPKKSAMTTLANIGGKLSNFESLLESFEGNFESSEGKQNPQDTQSFEPKNLSGSMDYVSNEGTGPAYGTNSSYSTTGEQSYVSGSMNYVSQEGNTSITSVPLGTGLGSLKAYDPDANYENLDNNDHLFIGSFKLNRQSLQQAFVLAEVLGKRGGKYAWTKR